MSNNDVPIGPTGGQAENPKVGELTHGGFRRNIHHQGIENLADERHMGRDVLRQTTGGYPDELLTEGVDTIMGATPVRGSKESYKVSKWSGARAGRK